MALPKRFVFQCPMCDQYLEADVNYFALALSGDENGDGIEGELTFFARHSCNNVTQIEGTS